MKSQATKTRSRTSKALSIIIIIIGVAISAAPLIHIYLPKKNPEVVAYSKLLDAKIDPIDKEISDLREKYNSSEVSANEFIKLNDELLLLKQVQVKENDKLYRNKVDESRIFGFKTLRVFLVAIGIRIVYLFFAITISIMFLLFKPEKGLLRNSLIAFQVFAYAISLYEIVWVFWNAQDYPIQTYWWAILLFTLLVSTVLVWFLTWRKFKIERLEDIARNWISFSFRIEKKNNYIKPEKLNSYKKDRTSLIKESLHNE